LRPLPVPRTNAKMEIMNPTPNAEGRRAFTIIELLVVILIIGILVGFSFAAFQGVLERAKKVQAKNDLTQIVTAVNAFYTEYGKYPLVTDDTPIANTADLFYTLRAVASGANAPVNGVPAINPRAIVFISPPDVKNPANPRSGIGSDGQFYDPWGTPYVVTIDGNYDNQIANPYSDSDGSAGAAQLRSGVIAYSFGKNGALGGGAAASSKYAAESGTAGKYKASSDVISWQ
jgi:prepilin-type N-terminal cleavage/methylation domain-containing protein